MKMTVKYTNPRKHQTTKKLETAEN